jgi:CheY-like chemotaxis protein
VLVVDDTQDIALFFAFLLERAGYEVEAAYSGERALELARQERFHLVISDIGMPRMDGYELARQLRQLPGYESVPLIAVTGYAQFYERDRTIVAGYDAHLKKPVEADALLRAINILDEGSDGPV